MARLNRKENKTIRKIDGQLPDSDITAVTKTTFRMNNMAGMKRQLIPFEDIISQTIQKTGNLNWIATEQRRQELVRVYHKELIASGYGMKRSLLKKKDMIDMRAVKETHNPSDFPELPLNDSDEYLSYVINNDMFYRTIPCFTEGVIRCNLSRYIYFKVLKLDLDNRRISLFLQDYMTSMDVWSPGVSGEITLTVHKEDQMADVFTDPDKQFLYSRIYRLLDYKKLFSQQTSDINVWENVVLPYAERTEEALAGKDTNNLLELTKIFCQYVSLSNYYLLNNRPKAVKTSSDKKTKIKKPDENARTDTRPDEEPSVPKKLVRTVGIIAITSEKPPRAVTERSAPKYKVASWKARGFTRRTKSGKLVYVKESIRHRKQLNHENNTIPQSVIIMKNNTRKNDKKEKSP